MPVEDLTIRLRVDDSELARRESQLFQVGKRGIPGFVQPVNQAPMSHFASGLAGNLLGSEIARKEVHLLNAQNNAIQTQLTDGGQMELFSVEKQFTQKQYRGMERILSDPNAMVFRNNSLSVSDPFPNENVSRSDIDSLLKHQSNIVPVPRTSAEARQLALGHQIGSGGTIQSIEVPSTVFTQPLFKDRVGGIYGPTSPMYQKHGMVRRVTDFASDAFGPTVDFLKLPEGRFKYNKGKPVAELASLGRAVLPVASMGALIGSMKSINDKRSEYLKQVLVGGDIPEGNPVGDTISMNSAKNVAQVLSKYALLPLEIGFGALSIYNWAWEELFGDGANANNRDWLSWEINIDATRNFIIDFVGGFDDAYKDVEQKQRAWYKAKQRAVDAAREEAKRFGYDVASRLQGLGASGLNLDELAEKFKNHGGLEDFLVNKAQTEFKGTVHKPTKKDVNLYYDSDVRQGFFASLGELSGLGS